MAAVPENINLYIHLSLVNMKNRLLKIIKTFRLSPIFCFLFFLFSQPALAGDASSKEMQDFLSVLEDRCTAYGWEKINLDEIPWEYHRITRQKRPLFFVQFGAGSNCTLFLGGVHGDELPTVYVLIRLADMIKKNPDLFENECIVIAPLVNPDGFFTDPPQRVNANGVDINRNFPTREWNTKAIRLWEKDTNKNKRYYPGSKPGSEQETLFQIALINRFKPEKIVSIHSPLNFYDFDGQSAELDNFEQWLDAISIETNHPFKKYGVFPGSLGNYAGIERDILTLTLELPSSNPEKGQEYFDKFFAALLKFTDLSMALQ
jgi:murein peptide amidase A